MLNKRAFKYFSRISDIGGYPSKKKSDVPSKRPTQLISLRRVLEDQKFFFWINNKNWTIKGAIITKKWLYQKNFWNHEKSKTKNLFKKILPKKIFWKNLECLFLEKSVRLDEFMVWVFQKFRQVTLKIRQSQAK